MSKIDTFKTIFEIITDIWNTVSKHKNDEITSKTEDDVCSVMVNELQEVKNKYMGDKRREKLADVIITAILEFIFAKEE